MAILKKYLKAKPVCNVTFSIDAKVGKKYKSASVVGDFNNWEQKKNEMKQLKTGKFKATIQLPCDHEYQFRYILDGTTWENDNAADKYVVTSFGDSDNCVINI